MDSQLRELIRDMLMVGRVPPKHKLRIKGGKLLGYDKVDSITDNFFRKFRGDSFQESITFIREMMVNLNNSIKIYQNCAYYDDLKTTNECLGKGISELKKVYSNNIVMNSFLETTSMELDKWFAN